MDFAFTAEAGLAGLFLASFLSATLLPGGSEAVLFAVIRQHPEQAMAALVLATVGNTLGGMTTYGMGRLLPAQLPVVTGRSDSAPPKFAASHAAMLRRWGPAALLLAWAPIIGDALCAAAGWLRLPPAACTLWMATGKAARYALIVAGAGML
ncbi:MAG: DedA family protein [Sulfuritalea sp.]|jgi:membrane protein YqaA with SNARE-associated domain|nr:DedA family protein [Sulfuritalea sp.]